MEKLIVIGSGGHAASCIDVIDPQKSIKLLDCYVIEKIGEKAQGYKIIGRLKDLKNSKKKSKNIFIAIGQISSPKIRIFLIFLKN